MQPNGHLIRQVLTHQLPVEALEYCAVVQPTHSGHTKQKNPNTGC